MADGFAFGVGFAIAVVVVVVVGYYGVQLCVAAILIAAEFFQLRRWRREAEQRERDRAR